MNTGPRKEILRGKRRAIASVLGAVSLLAGTALALTACGSGEPESAAAAPEPQTPKQHAVSATLGEFSISVDRSTVAAGDVVFKIKNKGAIEHEFVVMKTDMAADKLPAVGDKVEEANIPGAEATKVEAEEIAPGASVDLKAKLTPGNWVIICNLPGHYGHGMSAALKVQ